MDYRAEYWQEDPPVFERPEEMTSLLRSLPRRVRRDAIRTLQGQLLRTELYALDGSERDSRPYTVTERLTGLSAIPTRDSAPDDPYAQVFFPHLLAERTTEWERGAEPMYRFAFTDKYDNYGQPRSQIQVAVPRGRDWRQTAAVAEPYLVTHVGTEFATPVDPDRYLVDRVARSTTVEILNDGTMTLDTLKASIETGAAACRTIGHVVHFYDGTAWEGLAAGLVGDYGALVRTETLVITETLLEDAYRSGSSVLNPPELPSYLVPPGTSPSWDAEYPAGFRSALPALAGYQYHSADGTFEAGYYAVTAHQCYDFQVQGAVWPRGLRVALRDPAGHETSIAYDERQLLPVEVTDPAGLVMQAAFDDRLLQPALVTDPNGNRTAYGYTPMGLLERIAVMGREGATEPEGDTLEQPGTLYQYQLLTFVQSPANDRQPAYVHVAQRLQHRWELVAAVNAERAQNSQPPLIQTEIDTLFPADELEVYPERFLQSRVYTDGFGRQLQTRASAASVRYDDPTWGGAGLPADPTVIPGAAVGVAVGENDPPRVVVSGWQTYDNKGRVVEKFEPFFGAGWEYDPAEADAGQKVSIYYDPRGQALRTRNPDGSEQRVVIGVPDDLSDPETFTPTPWERYTYDANDNAGRTHASSSSGYSAHWDTPSSDTLDALGRVIQSVARKGTAAATDWFITRSSYDIQGNLLTVTDPLGRVVFRHVYDLQKRPWRVESLDAGIRRLVLDANGQPVERRDSKGALLLTSYDLLNRPSLVWARDNGSGSVTLRQRLEYGDAGDPNQSTTDRELARSVNALGRPVTHYDEAGLLRSGGYDFKGNELEQIRRVIRDDVLLEVYAGASSNNWEIPLFQVDWEPPSGTTFEDHAEALLEEREYQTSFTFDAQGRVLIRKNPEQVVGGTGRRELRYTYDEAGALTGIDLDQTPYVRRVAYNARGQRVLIARGNGVMTRYAYDAQTFRLARLRSERYTVSSSTPDTYQPSASSGPLQDLSYTYDLVGNPLTIQDRTPGSGVSPSPDLLTRAFGYDPLYRLTSATGRECSHLPYPLPWNEDHGAGNNCTTNQSNAPDLTALYQETFEYDPAGNLVRLRHQKDGAAWVRYMGIGGMNYDDWTDAWQAQLNGGSEWAGAPGNRLTHFGSASTTTASHVYDTCGNLIEEEVTRHFEWDHSDRLRVFRQQSGGAEPSVHAQHLYDAAGRRVKKLVRKQGANPVEVTVYADGVFEYQSIDDGSMVEENHTLHVMDGERRVAMVRLGTAFSGDTSPAVKYHLEDHLGSSVVVVDDQGSWVNREEFSAYGETVFGGFARKRYRFTGKERDEESGLSYHGARYYAPWMGRWVSCDPAGMVDGLNLYRYGQNHPIRMIDSTGMVATTASNLETATTPKLQESLSHRGMPASPEEGQWAQPSVDKDDAKGKSSSPTRQVIDEHRIMASAAGMPKPGDDKCKKLFDLIWDIIYSKRPPTPPGGKPMGRQGLAERWREFAENRGNWGYRPDGQPGTKVKNHIEHYRNEQRELRDKLERWDKNRCDDPDRPGGGLQLPILAREYSKQEPQLGPGKPLVPVPAVYTTPTNTQQVPGPSSPAAVDVVTVGGMVVIGLIIVSRIVRLFPPLLPLQASPL